MKELFLENNEEVLENFEIILDRAKTEKLAMTNCLDYYQLLTEDYNIEISVDEVVDLAETYGYDFSDFKELVNKNCNYEL